MSENNKWWTLLAVSIAAFMLLLDVSIVNVALVKIQDELDASFSDLQWVIDAYALTLAAFLLMWGSLSDVVGRKRIFLLGIGIFTLASLACGLSVNPMMLNLSRALQGIGSAAMFATGLALIAQEFQGKERGTAFAVWGAVTGGAIAIGPLIGGVLTDAFGWESIFFVNVPVGLLALAMTTMKVIDTHERNHDERIDMVGFVTFSVALFLLIYGLVRGNLDGWDSPKIVGSFVGAAILLVAFLIAELRGRDPMFDLSLLRKPTFVGASVGAVALSSSIFALYFYISLYFQNVLGHTPLQTGVRFLPTTVLAFVVAAIAGKASTHVPIKALMGTGLACIGAGLVIMAVMVHADSDWLAIMPGLCLTGLGIGLVNPALVSSAVGVVEPRKSGMASGINSTFRQVGLAAGIAGLGAIFQHRITGDLHDRLTGRVDESVQSQISESVMGGRITSTVAALGDDTRQYVMTAIDASFVHSFRTVSMVAAVIAIAGSVVAFATVRKQDFVTASPTSNETTTDVTTG